MKYAKDRWEDDGGRQGDESVSYLSEPLLRGLVGINHSRLVRLTLPSGNLAIYERPAEWMTAAHTRKYGLHVATRLDGSWYIVRWHAVKPATTEEVAIFDGCPELKE